MKAAVKAGCWILFSFTPALKTEGKPPFTLSGNPGDGSYQSFLANDTRHSSLTRTFPDCTPNPFTFPDEAALKRFDYLRKLLECSGKQRHKRTGQSVLAMRVLQLRPGFFPRFSDVAGRAKVEGFWGDFCWVGMN